MSHDAPSILLVIVVAVTIAAAVEMTVLLFLHGGFRRHPEEEADDR